MDHIKIFVVTECKQAEDVPTLPVDSVDYRKTKRPLPPSEHVNGGDANGLTDSAPAFIISSFTTTKVNSKLKRETIFTAPGVSSTA